MKGTKKKLSQADSEELLKILKTRFEKNMKRHKSIKWTDVETRLEASPDKHW